MSDLPYHKAPASLAGIDKWLNVDCSACKRPISGCCTDSTCEQKGAMCGIRAIAALAKGCPAQTSAGGVTEEAEHQCGGPSESCLYIGCTECGMTEEKLRKLCEDLQTHIDESEAVAQDDGWVKCSERTPEIGAAVLTYCAHYGSIRIASYEIWDADQPEMAWIEPQELMRIRPPTHWRPLPTLPKAPGEGK